MKKNSEIKTINHRKNWSKPVCTTIDLQKTQGNSKSTGWTGPEGQVFVFWTLSPS